MSIWEKMGFSKKGPKLTPEQEQENQRVAIVRELLMLEKRIKEVEKNMEFEPVHADVDLLNNLQEKIDELNEKLVALGGKPIKREETDRGPAPAVEQKRGERPIGREAAERIVEETAEALAEKIPREGRRPTKRDFGVIQGGKRSSAEEKK